MAKRKYFRRRAAVLLFAFFLSVGFVLLIRSCIKHETEAQKTETHYMIPAAEEKPIPVYYDTPALSDLTYPFNTMSADWDSDTLIGWRHYEIPEEYQKYGCLPDIVQVYTYCLCRQRDVSYTMVLAMMEVESGYRWNAKSDKGAVGYLQVVPSQH